MTSCTPRIRKALFFLAVPALLGGLVRSAPAADLAQLFQPYQALLGRHLVGHELPDGGLVSAFDYREALAAGERPALLAEQRRRLAGFDPASLDTRQAALAFWINAYNFFMIDYILGNPIDGEPPESVRDYGALLNPHAVFERKLFDIGGRAKARLAATDVIEFIAYDWSLNSPENFKPVLDGFAGGR